MDVIPFTDLIKVIKTAAAISKELLSLGLSKDASAKTSELSAELISAQQHATTAYSAQMEITKRVGELEKELIRYKEWSVEKRDYELKSIRGTAFAYAIKETVETPETKHWLCQPCFENAKKSVLQGKGPPAIGRGRYWSCNSCGTNILVPGTDTPESTK